MCSCLCQYVVMVDGKLCFVEASLLGNTLIHTCTPIIPVCLGTHRQTDLYYFYTLTSQLILTGRTIIIIVEEMFTEFSVYHDLMLCPGDCSCNCSVLSLSIDGHKKATFMRVKYLKRRSPAMEIICSICM